MPKPIQNPQLSNEVRDEADLQGKNPLSMDEIVVPTLVVGGDFPSHVWEGIGQGWCWGHTEVVAAAGLHALAGLHNPPGSNVIGHVTRISSSVLAGALPLQHLVDWVVSSGIVGGAAVTDRSQPVDTRRYPGITDLTQTHIRWWTWDSQPTPLLGGVGWSHQLGAPANERDHQASPVNIVLVPGTTLYAVSRLPDQDIVVQCQWNERPARSAELARLAQG